MNTLNLFHIIFREVVHTTEWIADSLNSPQGCTSGTNASDSQQALLSTCTKRRHRGSSTMWSILGEKCDYAQLPAVKTCKRLFYKRGCQEHFSPYAGGADFLRGIQSLPP